MGVFQSDFDPTLALEPSERDRLHAELWANFSAKVEALVRSGKPRMHAERDAIEPTWEAFIARHPKLRGRFRIRIVQP